MKPRATSVAAEVMEGTHRFELTEAEAAKIFASQIYQDVIATRAFQRLKNIHFLGSLDYVIDPNGPKPSKRHTRYQHSLGVARLALQFARDKLLSKRDEELCVIAALLHDIGHAPLSHSLESVFKKEFGIGHHIVSERIIKGDAPIGTGLYKVLRKWNVNPFEVLAIIDGKGTGRHKELFNYAINIDTIEAIIRSSTYIFPNSLCRPPAEVLTAFLFPDAESTKILDSFWQLKNDVYSMLIQSRTGVLADFICQRYMSDSIGEFDKESYYFTEADLEKQHPKLFKMLSELPSPASLTLIQDFGIIPFARRRFLVNDHVRLTSSYSVNERYRQTRTDDCYR